MPIPGPRNQFGPTPGYRNPHHAQPDLFNHWKRPGPVFWPGRTPALMTITLRGCILGAGQIRQFYRQAINLVPAQSAFSWTADGLQANGTPVPTTNGVDITRSLRYLTKSVYVGGGIDNSRYGALHTVVRKEHFYKPVTLGHGQVRGRPTVRNRLTSFGSRVPTLNQTIVAAGNQSPGPATQA